MERDTVPFTIYNATEVPEQRLYEIMAENDRLRAALAKCVLVFEALADAGNYPKPLLNNGGWKFATDALHR
jgi:hypothetical protein